MANIHERIRATRKRAGLTQVDLAKAVGVARVSLTQWESGDTSPKGENLLKLARALGVTPDWLISGRGEPSATELEPAPIGGRMVPIISEVQAAGLTQEKSAHLIHVAIRTWKQHEAGDRTPHVALWELYLLKCGQHPTLAITEKPPVT